MSKKNNIGVYIQSIEAARIWEHVNRGSELQGEYKGYIPYSLELIKLRKEGLDEFAKRMTTIKEENSKVKRKLENKSITDLDSRTLKGIDKFYSDDVINIKFSSKVENINGVVKKINNKYKELISKKVAERDKRIELAGDDEQLVNGINKGHDDEITKMESKNESRIKRLKDIAELQSEVWNKSLTLAQLRDDLYEKGFTIKNYKGEDIHYIVYKRSSAKARTGECLFIRKELAESMVYWSRMGLTIPKDTKIDLAALSAYEALVTSSIESTIKIDPKNILLISDVESVFKQPVKNIIKVATTELISSKVIKNKKVTTFKQDGIKLFSVEEEGTITNSLWDGQGMLESSYFTGDYEGKGMILTRQHFFKSCLFNTHIQKFMKDTYKDDYQTATILDMIGNPMMVKDVHCIVTPSSLKIFKFSDLVGGDKQMYKDWKKLVSSKEENCQFGICKSESKTKLGSLDGIPLQQTSYQMINSLPLNRHNTEQLSKFEVKYINDLKNDDENFVKHLEHNATLTNANKMMADLYRHNPDIAKTEFFNNFKINEISEYVKHIKKGKLRIAGDYCVLVGNPYEMLLHSVKPFEEHNLESYTLHKNEVYTKLFDDGVDLAGFRNPHTSSNNLLFTINKHNDLIDTYFNFTNNIVAINAIEYPIQDILSGCDYDSDTALFTNEKIIVDVARDNKAKVCLNGVEATSNTYELTDLNRSKVDKAIASDVIGRIVNVGQAAQSIMYDTKNKKIMKNMEEVVEIISVASTIAIDLAKKSYKIDIVKELNRLDSIVKDNLKLKKVKGEASKTTEQKSYPMFMSSKKSRSYYKTAMDYIYGIFTVSDKQIKNELEEEFEIKINRGKELKTDEIIDIWDLVMKCDENGEIFEIKKANDKQEQEIIDAVNDYSFNVSAYHAQMSKSAEKEREQFAKAIVKESQELQKKMGKKTIKPVTIYAILYHAFCKESIEKNMIKVLNAVYLSSPNKFINIFMQKK
ncbi:hypothetical protein [Lysinibacillus agricola]|uniref:hypothetical protein n=1 Tax=Lysinibacillus agricola TaxID=2590012 RepID=UPI003C198A59